jgi:hypothetical protein
MTELLKSLVMIALFVLPVALVGLAVVCFGHCVSDMLDDREPAAGSGEQPRSRLQM